MKLVKFNVEPPTIWDGLLRLFIIGDSRFNYKISLWTKLYSISKCCHSCLTIMEIGPSRNQLFNTVNYLTKI